MMIELPRIPIAHLPTRVEPLERLSRLLGGPQLLIKRDDQTGLAFGGNKTRKLELLLADAASKGADTLVTAGAVQSNHCRQTAAAAARQGYKCVLVLAGDPPAHPSGNLLLDELLGAEIKWADRSRRSQLLQETYEAADRQGRRPYLIPYGGSSPLGAAAYALAIQEFLSQGIHADWIVVASSSGGTQAGMVAGAKLLGYRGNILGISIDEPAAELNARVAHLASDVASLFDERLDLRPEDILVDDHYLGEGYGMMGGLEVEAMRIFARLEGLLLDPVYTARAAGGMLDLIQKGFFQQDQTILFWHTGGQPALFAQPYQDRLTAG
jgi:D-cysteine desulfhydrase family pyridoxal phosphate-dependent enzyme